jgi:hypothetical protein
MAQILGWLRRKRLELGEWLYWRRRRGGATAKR